MKNDFSVDTSKQVKNDFLKKIRVPLGIALLLTGIEVAAGIWMIVHGMMIPQWDDISIYEIGVRGLHYLCVICIFVSLIKVIYDEKPFSHTLVLCARIICGLYLLGSILLPRLSGFETNYEIFSFGSFTLIDGNFLIRALLLYVFSEIIYEGFSMQKDIEEIL